MISATLQLPVVHTLPFVGANIFAPIMSFAKKQAAVFHSSTERELIAVEEGVRIEGLPIVTLWLFC